MTQILTNPLFPRYDETAVPRAMKAAADSGRWRERFRLSPSLQSEFGDVETYLAFMRYGGRETEPKPEVRTAPIVSPGVFRAESTAAQAIPSVATVPAPVAAPASVPVVHARSSATMSPTEYEALVAAGDAMLSRGARLATPKTTPKTAGGRR